MERIGKELSGKVSGNLMGLDFLRSNFSENTAIVYTCSSSWKGKIEKLIEKYSDQISFLGSDNFGGVSYSLPKSWIKISPPKVLSPAHKAAMLAGLQKKHLLEGGIS